MPRKFYFIIMIFLLAAALSSCQAFLEDYNYSPIGTTTSS